MLSLELGVVHTFLLKFFSDFEYSNTNSGYKFFFWSLKFSFITLSIDRNIFCKYSNFPFFLRIDFLCSGSLLIPDLGILGLLAALHNDREVEAFAYGAQSN